jgi:hypothetical protein
MKFGVREICDVVLKAKAAQKVGNKVFYKNEPVIYFDTLKTSSMEGTATTSYAQGGRGNSRLIAWEGERTVTFTMEDALISPAGFMILSGAGLVEATAKNTLKVHTTEQTNKVFVEGNEVNIVLSQRPFVGKISGKHEDLIYVMKLENGEVATEPYIPNHDTVTAVIFDEEQDKYIPADPDAADHEVDGFMITLLNGADDTRPTRAQSDDFMLADGKTPVFQTEDVVLVDYYVEHAAAAQQIEITPDKFGGNYYLEASTLFRDTNGVDMPAEFIIPNCKIQSNFTFTMASSGDPSTFTFTMDAFPDYTRFDPTKKVLAAIQIIQTGNAAEVGARTRTAHDPAHEKYLM